jgi:hypothetical protein
VWATRELSGRVHIVLINKSITTAQHVQVQMPGATTASVEWLEAPSASATSGVTLGTRTFGPSTSTGQFAGPMRTGKLDSVLGTYSIDLPPASAVMLTQ